MAENNEKMSPEGADSTGGEMGAGERSPEFYAETGRKGGHSQGKNKNPDEATKGQDGVGDMNRESNDE